MIHHERPGGAPLSRFDPSTSLGVALSLSKGDYAYDAAGNILTWRQQADSDAPTLWVFGYDPADHLMSAVHQTTHPTPAVIHRYAYTYDPAGNRTSEQIDDAVTVDTHLVARACRSHLRVDGNRRTPGSVCRCCCLQVTQQTRCNSIGADRLLTGPPDGTVTSVLARMG